MLPPRGLNQPPDPNAPDPNAAPDEAPPEVPPEEGGQQLPTDNMNAPMADALQDATPEEQAQYEQFVGRAWQLIYDDRTFPHVVEMLRGGAGPPNPEEAAPQQGAPGEPPQAGAAPTGGVPPEAPPGGVPSEAGGAPLPPEAGGAPPPEAGGAPPPPAAPPPEAGNVPPEAGGAPPEATPEGDTGGADNPGDPVGGLASATDMVVAKVGETAEQAGEKLQPDVVFHAAGDILEELAEISRRAKIKDYSDDPDALESAWFQALDLYRSRLQSAGAIDQPHAQADLQKLIEADKNGTYERIMRSLSDQDQSGPAGGPEPPPQKEKKPKGFNAAMGV